MLRSNYWPEYLLQPYFHLWTLNFEFELWTSMNNLKIKSWNFFQDIFAFCCSHVFFWYLFFISFDNFQEQFSLNFFYVVFSDFFLRFFREFLKHILLQKGFLMCFFSSAVFCFSLNFSSLFLEFADVFSFFLFCSCLLCFEISQINSFFLLT